MRAEIRFKQLRADYPLLGAALHLMTLDAGGGARCLVPFEALDFVATVETVHCRWTEDFLEMLTEAERETFVIGDEAERRKNYDPRFWVADALINSFGDGGVNCIATQQDKPKEA